MHIWATNSVWRVGGSVVSINSLIINSNMISLVKRVI